MLVNPASTTTGCTFACYGNPAEACGGANAMDIYSNTAYVVTATTTTSSAAPSSSH